MTIEDEVDRLIDERPGRELLDPTYDDQAVQIHDRVWRSAGMTASYLLDAGGERVIVNTGMGFETPHHLALFAELGRGPTSWIVTTQGHVDHVGGVSQFREPGTRYVAQANNQRCQRDDRRIEALRMQTAMLWFPGLPARIGDLIARYDARWEQDVPVPDVTFEDRMRFRAGDLEVELLHAPGGETIDSCIVWLPQHRVALVSNLFGPLFPHFPNFNTLRADLYRFAEPYLANVDRVRALGVETLVTGRHLPIVGAELIDACLARLHGAVEYVHDETLTMINAGRDPYDIMRSIELPAEHRVGQGYGKVSWGARTMFEQYTGWFQRRSTAELYGADPADATAALAALVDPAEALALATATLDSGDAATAIRLAEAVTANGADPAATRLLIAAHRRLLADGGDESFWEHGWLRHQIDRLQEELDES